MSNYNFNDIPSRGVIVAGTYSATVSDIQSRESKNHNPLKQVVFELSGGEKISDFLVETDNALWKIQNLLRACGLPCEGEITISDDWNELLGVELQIIVGSEEYQGKKRNTIEYIPKQGDDDVIDLEKDLEKLKK